MSPQKVSGRSRNGPKQQPFKFTGTLSVCRKSELSPTPHLYSSLFVLFHFPKPRIDIAQVTSKLIPVRHNANCLLLFLQLVTCLEPAIREVQHGLVNTITPCPLPVCKRFALFQQVLHARLKIVHLHFCELKQTK